MFTYVRSLWSKYRQLYKKGLKGIAAFAAIAVVIIFILFTMASRGMGLIFNEVMARQTMMNGTITVESLSATPWGTVSFEDLVWVNQDGVTLLTVPSGKFRVNMWDIVTRNFKASALKSLVLEDAVIVVDLDDNNRLDFAPPSPDVKKPVEQAEIKPKEPKKTTTERQEELGKRVRNFNWNGQHLDLKLELRNCQVELFQKNRHYVLTDFNAKIDLDSKKAMNMVMSSGKFGGTAIGDGVEIKGRIDLSGVAKKRMPTVDMDVNILGVDPSSLGFGNSIHDKMTLFTKVTGDLNRPLAMGRVSMPVLKIPALTFENIIGDVEYQDGILNFKEVTAHVYNGTLYAHGIYNLDTRAYDLTGVATNLDSGIALKTPEFEVPVSANLNFSSKGQPRDMEAWGSFWSGGGRYMLIPIKGITGNFHNQGKHLSFSDVKIEMPYTVISTNALHIDNGELTMGPLNITSNGGSNFILYDEDEYDEYDDQMDRLQDSMKRTQENTKRMKENAKGMQDGAKTWQQNAKDAQKGIKELQDHAESLKDIKHPLKNKD